MDIFINEAQTGVFRISMDMYSVILFICDILLTQYQIVMDGWQIQYYQARAETEDDCFLSVNEVDLWSLTHASFVNE